MGSGREARCRETLSAESVSNLEICLEDKDNEHDADDEEHVLQPQKLNIPAGTLGLHYLSQAQRSVSCACVCAGRSRPPPQFVEEEKGRRPG
jgi:hypothetical protein